MLNPPRTVVRREGGLYALERALHRRGFRYVAGADEAGRGACAGPLVAAAAVLPEGKRGEIEGLTDSKLLTPAARERIYGEVVRRAAAYAVVVVPAAEVDARGLHVCNLSAMRRAIASLVVRPEYVLTDGFPLPGTGLPGLAVWKGDQVAACVAAASVLAKVTRDRLMVDLHDRFPLYGFDEHKGYVTPEHNAALAEHGACAEHRFSYINVANASGRQGRPPRSRRPVAALVTAEALPGVDGVVSDPDAPVEAQLGVDGVVSDPDAPVEALLGVDGVVSDPDAPVEALTSADVDAAGVPAPPSDGVDDAAPAVPPLGEAPPPAADAAVDPTLGDPDAGGLPPERSGPPGGTVGVASGERLRPSSPVGEDGAMEGGER